ncbi:MAG: hypothetical protein ACXVEE_43510, partial [Polyangiales bacterium]
MPAALATIAKVDPAQVKFKVLDEPARGIWFVSAETPKDQHLRFGDLSGKKVGTLISGDGSPAIEGEVLGKLRSMKGDCDGIILTEDRSS